MVNLVDRRGVSRAGYASVFAFSFREPRIFLLRLVSKHPAIPVFEHVCRLRFPPPQKNPFFIFLVAIYGFFCLHLDRALPISASFFVEAFFCALNTIDFLCSLSSPAPSVLTLPFFLFFGQRSFSLSSVRAVKDDALLAASFFPCCAANRRLGCDPARSVFFSLNRFDSGSYSLFSLAPLRESAQSRRLQDVLFWLSFFIILLKSFFSSPGPSPCLFWFLKLRSPLF